MSPSDLRIVIADDEVLLRTALASLLTLEPDITVVGQAGDGHEAVVLTRQLKPDVVLLDLEMPHADGMDAATTLLAEDPAVAIVILTRHARPGALRAALQAGARGFVAKSIDPAELALAIRAVAGGSRYIDAQTSTNALLDDCPLSERELEVLDEARNGGTVKDIASQVHLAPGTVRNYLSSAMIKMGADTRYQAVRLAQARGWL